MYPHLCYGAHFMVDDRGYVSACGTGQCLLWIETQVPRLMYDRASLLVLCFDKW